MMPIASSAVDAYTLTGGRLVATAAALVALTGAILGGVALAPRSRTRTSTTALLAGAAGLVTGGLVVATADGGPGSGSGVVGGYAAVLLGLTAVTLGGVARVRSRRSV
ncbi:DUF6223 family protein [Cryptosporangium sp. NPDC051539]|uniref:DUF6223 family protein n=1 Tax=Cryptosporangium sp. NPDC051539 TaxID=3363962 RepID=UPI00379AD782